MTSGACVSSVIHIDSQLGYLQEVNTDKHGWTNYFICAYKVCYWFACQFVLRVHCSWQHCQVDLPSLLLLLC
jgi:hypothetical protein